MIMDGGSEEVRYDDLSLKHVLDSLAFPFYVLDAETFEVKVVNPAAREIGLTEGMTCHSFFHKSRTMCEEGSCPVEEVKRGKTNVRAEHALYDEHDGNHRTVELFSYPLLNGKGKVIEVIIYFFDVTERRAMEEMRKRYEFIVDTAKEFMTLVNREYVYEAVNRSYCEAQNRRCEEIVGRTVAEIWGARRFEQTIKGCFDTCFEGKEVHQEARFGFSGSGMGCFDLGYYPYYDSDGNVTHAVVVTHDITRRKHAEEALRLSEEKFSKAFRSSPERMAILTLEEGRYIDVNEEFLSATGFSRDEVIGRTSHELKVWADPDDGEKVILMLREKGEVNNYETRFRKKSGEVRTVLLSAVVTDCGDEPCIISLTRDITQRKQEEEALRMEVTSLKQHLLTDQLEHEDAFSAIMTRNKQMRAIFQYIEVIAASDQPVLITGETGVGKELIAKAIHTVSSREGSFVAVNVAGLDDIMFSDTLFGHRKGAYTGADQWREGLISRASGGTLFLDEIGDLIESSQVKLLRLLQERTYYPLGSDVPRETDIRIVVATNRNIQMLMSKGEFRNDLFYRLRAHQIHIPPLRERREDIPLLLEQFLNEASTSLRKNMPTVSPELLQLLTAYDFPGNVRELRAMIYDAVARHKSGRLSVEGFREFVKRDDIGMLSPGSPLSPGDADAIVRVLGRFPTLKEVEQLLISEALERSHRNQGIAASLLGMTRQALNKRLHRATELDKYRKP
jgi:two-component system response regulator HydG